MSTTKNPTPADLTKKAKKIIADNQYLTIASIGANNFPWVSPVCYAYDQNYHFYWVSMPDSRHSQNIAKNDRVSIAIFDSRQKIGPASVGLQMEGKAIQLPALKSATAAKLYFGRDYPYCGKDTNIFISALKKLLRNKTYSFYKFTPKIVWMNDPNSKTDVRIEISLNSPAVKNAIHDYDEEYLRRAHWDSGKPSSNMPLFLKLVKPGRDLVLDAGCGTGRDDGFLAKKGLRVIGIDASPVAISMAKGRSAGIPNLEFQIAKIEALPFPSNHFDAAYSGYTLGGQSLPKQASELARVLKPKAPLYVAMFTRTQYEKPDERDGNNPLSYVLQSFKKNFHIKKQTTDTYTENDDHGRHEHDRLRIILEKH